MRDILLFTLDDLGDRQGYVLAIFAIVLLAIGCVLLRDAYLWLIGLGEQVEEDASMADEHLLEDHDVTAVEPSASAAAFFAAPHPAFGKRHSEAA